MLCVEINAGPVSGGACVAWCSVACGTIGLFGTPIAAAACMAKCLPTCAVLGGAPIP